MKFLIILGGILLITGQVVGIYSVGIPLASGIAGFVPSFFMTFIVWLFTYAIALLYLESLMALPVGSNFLTFLDYYFGTNFKLITGALFLLFLNYYLLSYFNSLYPLLNELLGPFIPVNLASPFYAVLITLFFGALFSWGIKQTALINALLTIALCITLYFFFNLLSENFFPDRLVPSDWSLSVYCIPVLFGAYGFQTLVPTLIYLTKQDRKALHLILFFGTFLACVIYIFLDFFVIGNLSEERIWEAFQRKEYVTQGLPLLQETISIRNILNWYYFFAVSTSLIGYGLSLIDFYGDARNISPEERRGEKRISLVLLTLLPPAFISVIYPAIFSEKLNAFINIAQIFFCFLPICAAWSLRYHYPSTIPPFLFGKKVMLVLLSAILIFLIWIQGMTLIL